MALLEVKGLKVSSGGKGILKGIDLSLEEGKTAVIFGPNGSGKSTLLASIVGLPGFKITEGDVFFKGKNVKDLPLDERTRSGIGIGFQYPPAVKGVRLETLLSAIRPDKESMSRYSKMLGMDTYMGRDTNVGFSGGERKRSEILQLMMQMPELLLLDEPESGVDIENISVIAEALKAALEKDKPITMRKRSAIIITHTGFILDYIQADVAYVMIDGRILGCGSPSEIFEEIKAKGYKQCKKCLREGLCKGM